MCFWGVNVWIEKKFIFKFINKKAADKCLSLKFLQILKTFAPRCALNHSNFTKLIAKDRKLNFKDIFYPNGECSCKLLSTKCIFHICKFAQRVQGRLSTYLLQSLDLHFSSVNDKRGFSLLVSLLIYYSLLFMIIIHDCKIGETLSLSRNWKSKSSNLIFYKILWLLF